MYLWRVNVLIWLQHVVGICRRTWKSINNCYCDMLGSWPWRAWKRCPLYPCLNSYGCIVLRLPRPKNHNKYCRNGCCNWQNSNCKFIEIFFNNVMSWSIHYKKCIYEIMMPNISFLVVRATGLHKSFIGCVKFFVQFSHILMGIQKKLKSV